MRWPFDVKRCEAITEGNCVCEAHLMLCRVELTWMASAMALQLSSPRSLRPRLIDVTAVLPLSSAAKHSTAPTSFSSCPSKFHASRMCPKAMPSAPAFNTNTQERDKPVAKNG